ncbi:AraC family transcriptional regulator [Bacillus sp. B1-b2]|uniref:AraC family transcriptional regulator n=1 Tax=Bacillus sp. B1-b2 TaxID=2653201 RepID=UPI001261CC3C|nr:AraC family transcriptional regulator [Bacillus sp. B1-b2]KAB7665899.1 AraC family transcriptional regulator [Bacillus sp. B1-b2]
MTIESVQLRELGEVIIRNTSMDGVHSTAIPSLSFIRESQKTEPIHGVFRPSFCIIVQGKKEVFLAKEQFNYGAADYIVSSVHLPVTGQVVEATLENPYLAFKLEFTPKEILELLSEAKGQSGQGKNAKRALYINKVELSLLDAVLRLARLLDKKQDIPILSPLYKKEILYLIMQGKHGSALEQMAIAGSQTYQIRHVIDHIKKNFVQSFRIEDLAERANMSAATLHRYFKEVTAMSPIQFQKNLRLQEARRLLLSESTDAADVAFRVGYESPSQFSREYSRMYGYPPKEDIKRVREQVDHQINA